MYDNVKLLIDEEGYQLVPIPDEYPLKVGEEVFVNNLGGHISITPVDNIQAALEAGAAALGEDFMIEEYPDERFADYAPKPENGEEPEHGL